MSIYFKGVKVSSGAPEVQRDVLIQTIGLASNTQDGIMSKEDKIILNAIDTVYEKKNDAETDFAHSLDISQVESTGVVTISIKNLKGEVIDTDTLDLDTEHIIVSAILDYANKKIIFTLKNGSTIDCDISNLIDTLQGAITAEKERAEAKELSLSNRINQEVTDREKAITKAINDLDVDPVGGNEQYIKVVKQTDGKIIATAQTFDKAINNEIVTDNNVPSSLAVKTFVDNSIKALDKDQVGSGNNVSIITSISEADGIITATSEDRKGTINGETDQLVTEKGIKTFVNSSIENMAAFYVTYNAEGDAFPTRQSLTTATELYIGGVKLTKAPGKNDYCIVTADESKQGELAQAPTTKYTYTKTNEEIYDSNAWSYLYTVNSTGFTSAQMAAINSGITKDTRFDNIAYADKKLTKTINENQSDIVTIDTIKTDLDLNTTINNLDNSKTLKAITETNGIITVEQQDISIKTNQINDITATASELNVLDGITATTAELNYIDGVTDNIQTQLNNKMDMENPTGSGYFSLNRKADTTIGDYSFAEGYDTEVSGSYSHAEGYKSIASNWGSHAETCSTANGYGAHAENYSFANALCSHTEGNGTIANGRSQHVFGEYNKKDGTAPVKSTLNDERGTYVEIVGNGTDDDERTRSNARTLDWSGNEKLAGGLMINYNYSTNTGVSVGGGNIVVGSGIPSGTPTPAIYPTIYIDTTNKVLYYCLSGNNWVAVGANWA